MTVAEGNWVLPPMPGHDHNLLQSIVEIAVRDGIPPGIVWLTFVVRDKRCTAQECQFDLLEAGVVGGYVYRRGEPWFCRTVVQLVDTSFAFHRELEYPIDDLPWAVADGTEATARRKLAAYLEASGGERVEDLDPRLVAMRQTIVRKLKVAS